MQAKTKTFKQRIINASMWTFGGHMISQIIRLGSNLVMTRLLAPEMFGLMSIVVLILVGVSLLTDIGLAPNVIQSDKSDNPDFMDTIWTMQVIKGLFIWALMITFSLLLWFLISHNLMPTDTVYANPNLPILITAISFVAVISGLEPTWTMLATKSMNQALITKIEIGSQVFSVLVMVVWASFDKSVWALVAGALAASSAKSVLNYYFRKNRLNKWNFDRKVVKDVLSFGKWILLSTMVGFYAINGDRIILGALVDEKLLGLYSIAYMIISAISAVYGKLLASVIYPAFCEANTHSSEKLKQTYYKFRYIADFILLLSAGILFVAGVTTIDFLYDNRYHETGIILQVISISLIGLRYNVTEQYFVALSKPYMMTYSIILKTSILFILVPVAFHHFGFHGALWAIVISNFSSFPLTLFYKFKLNIFSLKRELLLLPVFLIGMGIGKVISLFELAS
jgi:O-antigen/teichoic acid export membrane protein